MNFEIEKKGKINKQDLLETKYLETLINKALELQIINEEDLINLQLKMLDLLKNRVEKYNGFSSSSILTDKAKIIMESNIYTIEMYLKKFLPDEAIQILYNSNIIDLYKEGRKIINRKIAICNVLHKQVLNNLLKTNNQTYNATVIGGIKGFLKVYDPEYNARDIKITVDYPLYNNLIDKLEGIELIEEYLESIYYENELCAIFPIENIERLLYSYSKDYEELVINIFRIVLTQAIGGVLAKENIRDLSISKTGLQHINKKFRTKTKEEIYYLIFEAYKKIGISNEKLARYVEKDISSLQCEIYNSFKHNNLDKIFINKNY